VFFLSNPIIFPAGSKGECTPCRLKMANPLEWIPKFGNHPEEIAGTEYTPLPGDFTRVCGEIQWRGGFASGF
jgi:hypothetical protein